MLTSFFVWRTEHPTHFPNVILIRENLIGHTDDLRVYPNQPVHPQSAITFFCPLYVKLWDIAAFFFIFFYCFWFLQIICPVISRYIFLSLGSTALQDYCTYFFNQTKLVSNRRKTPDYSQAEQLGLSHMWSDRGSNPQEEKSTDKGSTLLHTQPRDGGA